MNLNHTLALIISLILNLLQEIPYLIQSSVHLHLLPWLDHLHPRYQLLQLKYLQWYPNILPLLTATINPLQRSHLCSKLYPMKYLKIP